MYAGYLDFILVMYDIDGMGKPSSMSASPEKESPEEEGEKSGGGSLWSDWSHFRDLAYIAEAQRGTDDEYGVAAAVEQSCRPCIFSNISGSWFSVLI